MSGQAVGALIWVALITVLCLIESRRKRGRIRQVVSEAGASRTSTRLGAHAGPAWEQDTPYPECFEEE